MQVYDSTKQLRYGHLMIMTDQDHDGSHIKGLIMNFLHHFYPSLLQVNGFLLEFITPIVKVRQRSNLAASPPLLMCMRLVTAPANEVIITPIVKVRQFQNKGARQLLSSHACASCPVCQGWQLPLRLHAEAKSQL